MSATKRRQQKLMRKRNVQRYLCARGILLCWVRQCGDRCGHLEES